MKKILINGCSFTAGDAVTWHIHHPDIDWLKYIIQRKLHPVYSSKKIEACYNEYKLQLRKLDNIGGQLAKLLNTSVIDISLDGNSNDNISISTIGFLSKLKPEERKKYHVCIGWTEFTRRIRWIQRYGRFHNLHHGHIIDKKYILEKQFITEAIINSNDLDHLLNFLNNVILLENYLKNNDISYTFWKSLGISYNIAYVNLVSAVDNAVVDCNLFFHNNLMDASRWMPFDDNPLPWLGRAWSDIVDADDQWIDKESNCHPNLLAIKKIAEQLSRHIVQ